MRKFDCTNLERARKRLALAILLNISSSIIKSCNEQLSH